MVILSVIITYTGCKKESNDENNATKDQFIGTWQGILTFDASSEPFTSQSTLTILQSGDNLSGYLIIHNDPEIQRLRLITLTNGVYSMEVICGDPGHIDCHSWDFSGTLTLAETNLIKFNVSGVVCQEIQGTLTGDFTKISSIPDDSGYITFAQIGREWRYRFTGWDSSLCELKMNIDEDLGNGIFSAIVTTDCFGWPPKIWWYVSPNKWCDMDSTLLDTRILNVRADAKVGDVYQTILDGDTITVTVLSLSDPVTIEGTTYNCIKLLKEGTQWEQYFKGYCWMTFDIGLIKYEAIYPNQPHDVHYEELIFKNF